MSPVPLATLIAQLATLELLQAMYPTESTLAPESAQLAQSARDHVERLEKGKGRAKDDVEGKQWGGGALELSIELEIRDQLARNEEGMAESTSILIILTFSLSHSDPASISTKEQPLCQIRTNQPPWLARQAHADLQQSIQHRSFDPTIPTEDKEAYSLVRFAQTAFEESFALHCRERRKKEKEREGTVKEGGVQEEEVRVWFWFPSLSTREKRDDMVNWAPGYGLSGWVLAGKPGVLCLEGQSTKINDFMSEIKSLSWSDIPSFQKKVSERYRTPISENGRIFSGMIEITGLITQGGGRGNRGDMGELRDWMVEHGVGEEFGEVVGGGQF